MARWAGTLVFQNTEDRSAQWVTRDVMIDAETDSDRMGFLVQPLSAQD